VARGNQTFGGLSFNRGHLGASPRSSVNASEAKDPDPVRGTVAQHSPAIWVSSLYLVEGFWDSIPTLLSTLYKSFGMANQTIPVLLSQLYIPRILRSFMAPLIETHGSKRSWAGMLQFAMALFLGLGAVCVLSQSPIGYILAPFMLISLLSAAYDATADGVFATTLSRSNLIPGGYVGVQGAAYCVGQIAMSFPFIYLAGHLASSGNLPLSRAWAVTLAAAAVVMAVFAFLAVRILPDEAERREAAAATSSAGASFLGAWATFFSKPNIVRMMLVVFFYRFGEAFLDSYSLLFLQSPRSEGGLGANLRQMGTLSAFLPVGIALGRVAGGAFCTKLTLRRTFLVLALVVNIPHVIYFSMSVVRPNSIALIGIFTALEKFTYGFGTTGILLYILRELVPGRYPMSHYAFATGIIELARWVTGSASGLIFTTLGKSFSEYFIFVFLVSAIPIAFVLLAPFSHETEPKPAPSSP
jgi:MFS transporter, PAT family, beta-lactamase induction signal transducer AmpG